LEIESRISFQVGKLAEGLWYVCFSRSINETTIYVEQPEKSMCDGVGDVEGRLSRVDSQGPRVKIVFRVARQSKQYYKRQFSSAIEYVVSLRYRGANPEFTHAESERRMWARGKAVVP
jgi:hypothetical protein